MQKAHRLAILAASGALLAAGLFAFRSPSPSPSPSLIANPNPNPNPAEASADEEDAPSARAVDLRRDPGACSVTLRGEDPHLSLSDDAIAVAALDAFDARTGVAMVEQESTEGFTVKGCHGASVRVPVAPKLGRGAVEVQTSLVRGSPEWIDDAGLSGSVMARLVVGEIRAPCARQVGFLVLATLRGARIDIDATSPWEGTCAPSEPLTSVAWASSGETRIAFLEEVSPVGDASEQPAEAVAAERGVRLVQQRVWLKRGPRLVDVGLVTTGLETVDREEPGDVAVVIAETTRNMVAEIVGSHPEGGLSLRETWTLVSPPPDGAAAHTKSVDVLRTYRLEGDRLIRVPKGDPR